jgi:hypothetical protein
MEVSIGHGKMIQTNIMGEEVTHNVVWAFTGIFSEEELGLRATSGKE